MRYVLSLALVALTAASAAAGPSDGRWSVGAEGGMWKLVEGYWDYSNIDEFAGVSVRRGLSPHWTLELGMRHGTISPGVLALGEDAGWSTSSNFDFVTAIYNPTLMCSFQFSPASRFTPFVGLGAGATSWRVLDGTDHSPFFPGGTTLQGRSSEDDLYHELAKTNVTIAAEAGGEWWATESVSLRLGVRYHVLVNNDLDNVGLSSWNLGGDAQHVDANSGLVQGFLGLSFWFGSSDGDGDGIPNARDACPDDPEDRDGRQDEDGCPDLDDDGDGVADEADRCPDLAEDSDGFQDDDGCPDPDNDGDQVPDASDRCPDEPEDRDGFQDEDGCPDADNDGDGVPDPTDNCPDTPAGAAVGPDGCPPAAPAPGAAVPEPITIPEGAPLVLQGVTFRTGSAELTAESLAVLARVAAGISAHPEALIEVRGHTDAQGSAETNRDLSQRRAIAVREVLVQMGVPAGQLRAVGYGEDQPIADNATAAGRAQNRRVELHRVVE